MKLSHLSVLVPALCMILQACSQPKAGTGEAPSATPKWKNYNERLEEEAQQLRKQAGLKGRTMFLRDQAGAWIVAGTDSFDTNGHLVLSRLYDENKRVTQELLHRYEEERLVQTVQTDERGPLRMEFVYDAKGNKTTEFVINPEGDTTMTRHASLNEMGDEQEVKLWRKGNNVQPIKRSEYDAQRRPRTVKEFEGGVLNWQENYRHIGSERLEADRLDADGLVERRFVMHFDSAGHATRLEQFDRSNNRTSLLRKTYGPDGKLLKEETLNSKDEVNESSTFSYDEKGCVSKRLVVSGDTETEVRYENRYR